MRWALTKQPTDWHKWFAWHPVLVESTVVWLEVIERRDTGKCGDFDFDWEYRFALAAKGVDRG